jgi:hypothetical protein
MAAALITQVPGGFRRRRSRGRGQRVPSNVMFLSMIALVSGCHNRSCSSNSAFGGEEMPHH